MKKFNLIYKTTCLETGKWYIGMHSTDVVEDGYLGSGKVLLRSIKKHGRSRHVREVLEFLPDRKTLREREKEIVTEALVKDRQCMNTATGGIGGTLGIDSVLSGFKARAERIKNDPIYRAEHAKLASKAGKIGGKKGADARVQRMKDDPAFAAEVRAKMSVSAKAKWEERKRRFACPS